MRYVRYAPFSAVAGSASANSAALDANQLFNLSVQIIITGDIVGSFKIQVSNDAVPTGANGVAVPTNWSDLSGTSTAVSSAGVYLIPKQDMCYRWFRIVYTRTSSTSGVITANINALSM